MRYDLKSIPIICGPTASGKSALALKLCEMTGGELISCDSMQIYKHLDVGTAKPDKDEQSRVRHHLIDVIYSQEESFPLSVVEQVSIFLRFVTASDMLTVPCRMNS